jgi:hypothetical protein
MMVRVAFTAWATVALPQWAGDHLCVDDKTVLGCCNSENLAVHRVNVFAGKPVGY